MISSNFFKDSLTTNHLGEFILDTLYQSDYTFYYGSWGYRTKCEVITISNDSLPLLLNLEIHIMMILPLILAGLSLAIHRVELGKLEILILLLKMVKSITQVMIFLLIVIAML